MIALFPSLWRRLGVFAVVCRLVDYHAQSKANKHLIIFLLIFVINRTCCAGNCFILKRVRCLLTLYTFHSRSLRVPTCDVGVSSGWVSLYRRHWERYSGLPDASPSPYGCTVFEHFSVIYVGVTTFAVC